MTEPYRPLAEPIKCRMCGHNTWDKEGLCNDCFQMLRDAREHEMRINRHV